MLESKMRTDVSHFSAVTGASATPFKKKNQERKSDVKSPAMSPPRKDPIPNQYINRLITEQDPSIPPIIAKYPP